MKKAQKKRSKLIILAIIVGLLLMFAGLNFDEVIYPAYVSTAVSCMENGEEIAEEAGYVLAGRFSVETIVNETTGQEQQVSTTAIFSESPDPRVVKHEHIHLMQYRQHRLFECGILTPLHFLNEYEAYLLEGLPDRIFIPIYGNYSIS